MIIFAFMEIINNQAMFDKYTFEKSKIIKGIEDKMSLIETGAIGLICADLPFGKTKNEWDIVIPPEKLWKHYWRVIKPNGAIVLFGQDKFTAMMMLSDPNHRYNLIWEKTTVTGFFNANKMPLRCHEDMMVFYKKLPTYNPQKTTGHKPVNSYTKHTSDGSNYGKSKLGIKGGGSTERYPRSVWRFATDKQKSSLHPTQKPVLLIEEIVKTYSDAGEIVLDNTSGSGTLAEACINTNRDFIIIEKNPIDFEIGKERIRNLFKERRLGFRHLEVGI